MIDVASWEWPQFVYAVLILLGLGINLAMHGRPKEQTKYNIWVTLISTTIALTLLIFGGFFA